MNERIKELIVESGNGQMRDGRLYPHIGIRFEEDWQRFAELIVKECIRCCDDVDVIQKHYLKYGIDQELDANQCIEVIKKHFGVGE